MKELIKVIWFAVTAFLLYPLLVIAYCFTPGREQSEESAKFDNQGL